MQKIDQLVWLGKALADQNRMRILWCLTMRELCVCELTHLMDIGQPAVSRHLRILREAGLIEDRRAGQFVNYRVVRPPRSPLAKAVIDSLSAPPREGSALHVLSERTRTVDRACLTAFADGPPPSGD